MFFNRKHIVVGSAFIVGTMFGITSTGIAATMLGSDIFTDVARGSFYDKAIGEMYKDGIIKGYENTSRFGPDDYVTRGQIAVMLQRFRDDLEGSSDDDDNNDDSSSSRSRSSASSRSSSSSSSYVSVGNNPKGTFRFTTATYTANETQGSVTISVVRVGGNDGSVAVNYAVTGNSATVDSDFEALSGTLSFATKETSKSFVVKIKNDSVSEGNESATITLTSPTNGSNIGNPSTAAITIIDDESSNGSSSSKTSAASAASSNPNGTLSFGALTYSVFENAGSISVTIQRVGGSNGSVNVNYATSNGTGIAGSDYTSANGTLTFSGGETSKTITIPVMDDSSVDGGKTFTLTLSNATGGASIGQPTASVMMQDNENSDAPTGSGSLKFTKSTIDASEGSGKVDITVQRISGWQGTIVVNYATTNGTAFSGADFTYTSGTLTFASGETSKIISIPLVKDSSSESSDVFYVDLTSVNNSQLVSPYSVTVNLFD